MAYAVQERGNIVAEGVPEGLGEEGNALQGGLVVELLSRNERERGGSYCFPERLSLMISRRVSIFFKNKGISPTEILPRAISAAPRCSVSRTHSSK